MGIYTIRTGVLSFLTLSVICATGRELTGNPFLFPDIWSTLRSRRETADIHAGEFCVDVSTYGLLKFEQTPRKKCDTTFEKICETKDEKVCNEVTEIQCDIVPYTECEMLMEVTPYKSFDMVPKVFNKKICNETTEFIPHTKMMPECKNVTKQNCVTKWETDAEGKQVWAGNEDCEPVTWRECELVPRQVDFKVPKIECFDAEEIPYTDCVDAEKTQMTTSMVCKVKHTTNCHPAISTKCQNIKYQECKELPREVCEERQMMIPTQEREHKKKCLLPDIGAAGTGAVTPRGNKTDLDKVAAAAAAVAALDESESQQHSVSALPAKQKRPAVYQEPRQGKTFQGQVGTPRINQAVRNGQFIQN